MLRNCAGLKCTVHWWPLLCHEGCFYAVRGWEKGSCRAAIFWGARVCCSLSANHFDPLIKRSQHRVRNIGVISFRWLNYRGRQNKYDPPIRSQTFVRRRCLFTKWSLEEAANSILIALQHVRDSWARDVEYCQAWPEDIIIHSSSFFRLSNSRRPDHKNSKCWSPLGGVGYTN